MARLPFLPPLRTTFKESKPRFMWKSPTFNPAISARRNPTCNPTANMARSRTPSSVPGSGLSRMARACVCENASVIPSRRFTAATPKSEAQRCAAPDHHTPCIVVSLTAILPHTLQVLLHHRPLDITYRVHLDHIKLDQVCKETRQRREASTHGRGLTP